MRKGFDGLAVLVQRLLTQDPHSGALFAFRGKRGHLVKPLWFDGLCLFSKRLDRGRFVWPDRKGVTEVACRAHARRKTFDLHERSPTPPTTDIPERIDARYAVEAEVRGQPPDSRHRARQERSRPLADALRDVLDAALRRLSPKSDMAKAIAYATKRWVALSRFLDDGRLEIDSSIAERAPRGVAVGRRNRLFAGSRAGGGRAAAIHTVIHTCEANDVAPQPCTADVVAKIADDWPVSRWNEPSPRNRENPGASTSRASRITCRRQTTPTTQTFKGNWPASTSGRLWISFQQRSRTLRHASL